MKTKLIAPLFALAFAGCVANPPQVAAPASFSAPALVEPKSENGSPVIDPRHPRDRSGRRDLAAEEERAQKYRDSTVAAHPEWSDATKSAVRSGKVIVGMPEKAADAALNSLAHLRTKHVTDGVGGRVEIWNYDGTLQVVFANGVVTRWFQ